ncbi:Transcription factor, K-box [Dillenia turbinata]|uniref:Transcription factor, K-box n=1 Tax=Dillenia turbinata TaxID=194707 RepID=A0AAN8ZSI2_9MAGN
MGRRKIQIQKIEDAKKRHVAFSKRRKGLFKKANDLSVKFEAQVGIIVFSLSGRLYQFSTSRMEEILSKYHESVDDLQNPAEPDINDLKEHAEKLQLKSRQMIGLDIENLDIKELQELESKMTWGLATMKKQKILRYEKEKMLSNQLEKLKLQEQRILKENMALHRQLVELQSIMMPGKRKHFLNDFKPKYAKSGDMGSSLHLGYAH